MRRLLFLALILAWPAVAEEIPACNAARAGAVACLSGRLCECRFERGGSITGVATGHRWNCSILRPACGAALAPPAAMTPMPYPPEILVQPQLVPAPGMPGWAPPGWPDRRPR
jgi:hypothetical protein